MAKYIKAFSHTRLYLRSNGMTPQQIDDFYVSWLEGYRSDCRFEEHIWRFNNFEGTGEDGSGNLVDVPATIVIPWGSDGTQRQQKKHRKEQKEKGDKDGYSSWSSLKLNHYEINTPDFTVSIIEHYDDTSSLLSQIGDPELLDIIRNLPETEQIILEFKLRDARQKDIAEHFGITEAAISRRVNHIRNQLEPYFRKNHSLIG